MSRPIPIYLITVWFFIFFATLPQRYSNLVTSIIGIENFQMFTVVFIFGAIVISFKFFKCENIFVNFVVVFFSLYTFYVLKVIIWKMLQGSGELIVSHPMAILFIIANIFCIVYLLLPRNRIKIAKTRSLIEAEINRRFLLKRLGK